MLSSVSGQNAAEFHIKPLVAALGRLVKARAPALCEPPFQGGPLLAGHGDGLTTRELTPDLFGWDARDSRKIGGELRLVLVVPFALHRVGA